MEANTDVSFYIKKLDNHILRRIHTLYDRKKTDECSLMNMWVVDFLYNQKGRDIFQKDIEEEFFINRATASKMLALMEKKELIRRTVFTEDARLRKIQLLPRGVTLHEVYLSIRQEIEFQATASLTQEETALFKALCRKILSGLESNTPM